MDLPSGGVGWAAVIFAALGLIAELLRRRATGRDASKQELKEAENELREAVLSGDVDRVTRARHELDRLQK